MSFGAAWFGRAALRRRWRRWVELHITGMGFSYVLMLVAFYVDNGKQLPLWKDLRRSRIGCCRWRSERRSSVGAVAASIDATIAPRRPARMKLPSDGDHNDLVSSR